MAKQLNQNRKSSIVRHVVLMQDFTGVPAVVDLAAMRAAVARAGRPGKINPAVTGFSHRSPVMADYFASPQAFEQKVTAIERCNA